jgi:YesN/AraC family two-component response regulator
MIKIVLADDHTIVREGLRRVIAEIEGIDVVGEATNGHEVLEWVKRRL